MRIIEKACPKCGAALKFHTQDKEAKCEFCKSEFIIENNEKDDISKFDIENIKLISKIMTTFTIIPFIIGSIIMIIFIIFFIFIFLGFNKQIGNSIENDKDTDIIDIIDDKLDSDKDIEININDFDDNIKEKLSNYAIKESKNWQMTHEYSLQGDIETVGFYYLKNETFNNIQIYSVIKSIYSNGSNIKILYSSYVFRGKDIDSISYNPSLASKVYRLSQYDITYGYESLEELYDSDIRSNKSNYKIVATKDLYID